MTNISLDKKYRTRDGREVRILCTDAPGEFPVVGYVMDNSQFVSAHTWRADGTWAVLGDACDLVEARSAEDVAVDAALLTIGYNRTYTAKKVVAALREAGLLREDGE